MVTGGFFPPVSHMMRTMRTASPASSQDCTFFGSKPGGFGLLSWIAEGEVMAHFSGAVRVKLSFFFPTVR